MVQSQTSAFHPKCAAVSTYARVYQQVQRQESVLCSDGTMQLLNYHGPEPRKPLIAIAEVQLEGATFGVSTIGLKSHTADNELACQFVGAAFKHCFRKKPPKDIAINETTFC